MGFKLEKNNQREAYAEIPFLKICKNIYTVFLAVVVLVHYIMLCIVT